MFEPYHLLKDCYQLQCRLGQTNTHHQTWLAVELPPQKLKRFLLQQVRRRLPITLFDPPILPKVTVKLLAFSPQIQWDELKLFEREAQVLRTLNHPKIPRYRDFFEATSPLDEAVTWFALVQEYIEGYCLGEFIQKRQKLSEKQLRSFAQQILEILIYLHRLNPPILHRDIKPSNLILGTDNQLYLIDFGAVQAKPSVTGLTFTIVGTGGYAPLEQFWGKAVPASDLYALGTTLIHLATGIAPMDLPQQNSRLFFRDRLTFSQGFIQWLEILTALTPEQRFSSAEEALQALQYLSIPSLKFFTSPSRIKPSPAKISPTKTEIKLEQRSEIMTIDLPAKPLFLPHFLQGKSWQIKITLSLLGLSGMSLFGLIVWKIQPESVGYGLLIVTVLLAFKIAELGQNKSIHVDHQSLKLYHKFLLFPYKINQENLQDIIGIFAHQQNEDQYQLSINTKKKIYFLPSISQAESDWLLQEIQSWLRQQSQ